VSIISINKMQISKEVIQIIEKLKKANYEAFIVGGCVRDYLRNRKPKDWDITTSAWNSGYSK